MLLTVPITDLFLHFGETSMLISRSSASFYPPTNKNKSSFSLYPCQHYNFFFLKIGNLAALRHNTKLFLTSKSTDY
jgi:hypothetical protein